MNLYAAWLSNLGVDKSFSQGLVPRGHDLVESKRKFSNKIVLLQVLELLVIVAVKHLDFESVLLLKLEVNCNFSDPFWVQVIMDDLCLPDSLPDSTSLQEKDGEWVTF